MATRAKTRATTGEVGQLQATYEHDYYGWAVQQADALRGGRVDVLDLENLAERRSRSWSGSIRIQRINLLDVLDENPSLRRRQEEAVPSAYRYARAKAAIEMKRDEKTLAVECPYTLDDILNRPVEWPEE